MRARCPTSVDEFAAHVAGLRSGDMVFAGVRSEQALRVRILRRAVLDEAAATAGLEGLHPHELRHTAASLAIASGANVRSSSRCLATSRRR